MNPDPEDPFKGNADLIQAFEERPLTGGMKVPEHVLLALEKVRAESLTGATFSVIQGGVKESLKLEHKSGDKLKRERHPYALLRFTAILVLLASAVWLLLPRSVPTARVVITSPGDLIGETQPRIAWNSKDPPGQKYDVWILPAAGDHLTAPALFVVKGVTSPVSFDQLWRGAETTGSSLQPGEEYRVLVCLADAGRMAGVPVPFRVKLIDQTK